MFDWRRASYTFRPVAAIAEPAKAQPQRDPLEPFSPAVRDWFATSFEAPTDAQAGGWAAIARVATRSSTPRRGAARPSPPSCGASTGSPATQAPRPRAAEPGHVRVLYISPLKALTYDMERNLRAPLTGIGLAAQRLGEEPPRITVACRTGDTPAEERRQIARRPPDILITTPEIALPPAHQRGSRRSFAASST